MTQSKEFWRKVSILTLAGGLAFWVANFAISLTPIAAEYRAALSISYFPMLLEALIGSLIIGFFVSYSLLRLFDKLPTKDSILKSIIMSFIVLTIVTVLIEVPAKFLTTTSDALHYFLIGTMFNLIRIFALGIVIGYLYRRLDESVRK
jgi:branched-subunit amino acid ABC-type transport system permease component